MGSRWLGLFIALIGGVWGIFAWVAMVEVRLLGVNRHESHPLGGIYLPQEQLEVGGLYMQSLPQELPNLKQVYMLKD